MGMEYELNEETLNLLEDQLGLSREQLLMEQPSHSSKTDVYEWCEPSTLALLVEMLGLTREELLMGIAA